MCVRACVCACERACVCVCVCVYNLFVVWLINCSEHLASGN